jgi:hypothetical protein
MCLHKPLWDLRRNRPGDVPAVIESCDGVCNFSEASSGKICPFLGNLL